MSSQIKPHLFGFSAAYSQIHQLLIQALSQRRYRWNRHPPTTTLRLPICGPRDGLRGLEWGGGRRSRRLGLHRWLRT